MITWTKCLMLTAGLLALITANILTLCMAKGTGSYCTFNSVHQCLAA